MDDPSRAPVPNADLDLAKEAIGWAREAGELTLRYFRDIELHVETKGDGTPVTRADREAEALIRERIGAERPSDAIHGEEHGRQLGTSGCSWTIDPIDGTKAFSRGVPTYSNLVQFEDLHGPAVGIINLPALNECVWAARGHGAFLGEEPLPRLEPGSGGLEGRLLCISGFHDWDAEMFARIRSAGVEIRTWGDAYGYVLVASGRADAMFDPQLEWWDLAAVQVICAEAGVSITRRDGDPDISTPAVSQAYGYSAIASGGGSHRSWVEVLSGR